jgi:hypothetical protein
LPCLRVMGKQIARNSHCETFFSIFKRRLGHQTSESAGQFLKFLKIFTVLTAPIDWLSTPEFPHFGFSQKNYFKKASHKWGRKLKMEKFVLIKPSKFLFVNSQSQIQPSYFFIMTEALWPPKPKVLLKMALTSRCCASLKVRFRRLSNSGSSVK